ncbi:MAG: class I SAM-dependent methyltransferase [bacterium]|nr:MAG: class I SAM-dependent methyltransferase [bacterium]
MRRRLPHDRTYEQVKRHYEVEKAIAERLKSGSREVRERIYACMYDEVLAKVPDHPRLAARDDEGRIEEIGRRTHEIVEKYVNTDTVFAEFAPGDCSFAYYISRYVREVYAVDISKQSSGKYQEPSNFSLIIYNGYDLDMADNSVDVAFSDQLIEHLHPEDVEHHFDLVKRILREGGIYIFRTPHAYFGPWDVSKYFSDTPEGFHLKEWTYSGLEKIIKKLHYSRVYGYKKIGKNFIIIRPLYFKIVEKLLSIFPMKLRRKVSRPLLPMKMIVVLVK